MTGMIRRGFWLITGAVLGVAGYRKASRVADSVLGPSGRERIRMAVSVLGLTSGQRPARSRAAVPAGQRAALPAGPRRAQAAGPSQSQSQSQAVRRPTGGFVRDVRDGMAEYRDLHRGELDRTLGNQSDRTSSGDSWLGHREP